MLRMVLSSLVKGSDCAGFVWLSTLGVIALHPLPPLSKQTPLSDARADLHLRSSPAPGWTTTKMPGDGASDKSKDEAIGACNHEEKHACR